MIYDYEISSTFGLSVSLIARLYWLWKSSFLIQINLKAILDTAYCWKLKTEDWKLKTENTTAK